jgi:hypothetical protein
MAYNFQTGNNKINLLTDYKSVTEIIICTIKRFALHFHIP